MTVTAPAPGPLAGSPTETAHRTPHSGADPDAGAQGAARAIARARVAVSEGAGKRGAERSQRWPGWLDTTTGRAWRWASAYALGDVPTVWSESPAPLAELVRYARYGAWVGPGSMFWRCLGVAWCVLVAIPISTVAYYAAWFCQRPGRLLTAGVVALTVWLTW